MSAHAADTKHSAGTARRRGPGYQAAVPLDGRLRSRSCRSSPPAFGISYRTLRDQAFTVTGGEVTKARHLEQGKNTRREISVTPDGDGTVTIVLPPITDCVADGAICTGDGRMQSSRLEITVPGPGG